MLVGGGRQMQRAAATPHPVGLTRASRAPACAALRGDPFTASLTSLLCSVASCSSALLLHMLRLAPVRHRPRAACLSML